MIHVRISHLACTQEEVRLLNTQIQPVLLRDVACEPVQVNFGFQDRARDRLCVAVSRKLPPPVRFLDRFYQTVEKSLIARSTNGSPFLNTLLIIQ
jgi:hypothetical protein